MIKLIEHAKLNEQSENVANLQSYLARYGYFKFIDNPDFGLFGDSTHQAILIFQKKQGLEPTGELDEHTIQLMNTPRCGVADFPEFSTDGRCWDKTELTYGFINFTNDLSENDIRWAIQQAFGFWSSVTALRFNEISVSNNPDIKILFTTGNHGDNLPFDGPRGMLAHAYYPPPNGGDLAGDTHFDDSETWSVSLPPGSNTFDLVTVAAHEFGHSLGLGHSSVSNSLMYAYYSGPHRYLHTDDISGIQYVYPPLSRFVAHGGELGQHLSHAFFRVGLQPKYQGLGEAWLCRNRGNNELSIECLGAEKFSFLSHAHDKVWLQNGYRGAGEAWAIHNLGDNKVAIECLGAERGKFLSHAHGRIWLQNGYKGTGEMWSKIDQ